MDMMKKLSEELNWNQEQVEKVVEMLENGEAIPAEYKEIIDLYFKVIE